MPARPNKERRCDSGEARDRQGGCAWAGDRRGARRERCASARAAARVRVLTAAEREAPSEREALRDGQPSIPLSTADRRVLGTARPRGPVPLV